MCASLGDRVRGPHQKVNLLIPGHIPGSVSASRYSYTLPLHDALPICTAVVPGPTTGAPPEPTREHHKGTPLRTQSAIGAHFVKLDRKGNLLTSFPTLR